MTTNERLPENAPRIDLAKLAPDVFKALIRLDTAARQGVDQKLVELVKIRASQINHCAYCIDMHTKDALAHGESVDRIVQPSTWGESRHFYTAKEAVSSSAATPAQAH
jgi:AhpD family alkylhydroperoxidase